MNRCHVYRFIIVLNAKGLSGMFDRHLMMTIAKRTELSLSNVCVFF